MLTMGLLPLWSGLLQGFDVVYDAVVVVIRAFGVWCRMCLRFVLCCYDCVFALLGCCLGGVPLVDGLCVFVAYLYFACGFKHVGLV